MMRLSVSGVNNEIGEELCNRVPGVVVRNMTNGQPDTGSADAVAFLGESPPRISEIQQCLELGKHVLVATEALLPLDALASSMEVASAAGVRFVCQNLDRLAPSRQLIQSELRGAKFGAPGLIRLHRWRSSPSAAKLPFSLPCDLIRDLDVVTWLMRQQPEIVFAWGRALDNSKSPGAGTVQVHLGFAGGGMALVDYVDSLPEGSSYRSLSAICASGALYADDHSNCQLAITGAGMQAEAAAEGIIHLVTALREFTNAIATGEEPASGQPRWSALRQMADAVLESLETGQSATLRDA